MTPPEAPAVQKVEGLNAEMRRLLQTTANTIAAQMPAVVSRKHDGQWFRLWRNINEALAKADAILGVEGGSSGAESAAACPSDCAATAIHRKSDGERLLEAFAETFEGGGWAEAPTWDEYDTDEQDRWDRTARIFLMNVAVQMDDGPAEPADAAATEGPCDLEEALRLTEVGEYLYDAKSFKAGDGYHEPREFSINWEWQQHKPDTYGEGALLAEAVAWHEEMRAEGIETQAYRLRRLLAGILPTPAATEAGQRSEGGEG